MMFSPRVLVLSALILSPVLVYVALGVYAMWVSGLTIWAWLFLPVCWVTAWLVGRFWPPASLDSLAPLHAGSHWTDRDKSAMGIVRTRQKSVTDHSPTELVDPHFYVEQVKLLAMELAAHYYPHAKDPYSALKVSEVLSAIHLAVEDMEELTIKKLPVAQWLTIGQWQSLGQSQKWYTRINESVWLTSILYNPLNLLRYVTSKATVEALSQQVQQEILVRLYMGFISQVGYYLIEMNSGRLRGGTQRYRKYFGTDRPADLNEGDFTERPESERPQTPEPMPSAPVQIVLIGQVSSGKSSLINALLADQQAECDVLPTTRDVSRYSLPIPNAQDSVQVLDTPGYGEAGASDQQQKQIETAVTSADVVLLVMSANTPARKPDQSILEHLESFFAGRPDLKFPHVVGVLSHVDLLKPSLEWKPPYNWQHPTSLKEKNIRGSLDYVASIIGPRVSTVIPICTAAESERQWGVKDALFPAIVNALPEAKATSLLRLFETEMKETNWRKILHDAKQTGQELFRYWRNRSVRSD